MKVIILKTGEVKDVALGYAVNYLLPKKLAVIATKQKLEGNETESGRVEGSKESGRNS